MTLTIQLDDSETKVSEHDLRETLWGLLVPVTAPRTRGKAFRPKPTSLSVWQQGENGTNFPSTNPEPDWVMVVARTVREVVPHAVVTRGWVTEGVLRYDLTQHPYPFTTAENLAHMERLVVLAIDGEVEVVGPERFRSMLEGLDPFKTSRVSASRGDYTLSRLVLGPDQVESFITDFEAKVPLPKDKSITKAMRKAMVAPMTTMVLMGYPTRLVDQHRKSIIVHGLEYERDCMKNRGEDKASRSRLTAANKALAFIEENGLPNDVEAFLPTCGPSVTRSWAPDDDE